MSTRTTGLRAVRGGSRAVASVAVIAGVGYLTAWTVSQLVGAPNPSIAASGAQVVASFAGRGGQNMAMFVLAEGVAAVALVGVVVVIARAALQRDARPRVRLAAQLGAAFAIAAAAVSLIELGLGSWLVTALVPDRRPGTAGAVYHAVYRLDGTKLFLLAVMAVAMSALAMTTQVLPGWLAPLGFALAVSLVVSGIGLVLLVPGLGDVVYVSGPLLIAFITSCGVTFGLRASRPGKTA